MVTNATGTLLEASVTVNGGNRSLSELAYEKLLDMLLSGELAAGVVLQERKLADSLNISRTPVREALNHLEAEGLVSRDVGRLMTVSRISVQNYIEILQVRKLLETEAAGLAAGYIEQTTAENIRNEIRKLMDTPNPTAAHHWAVDDLVHSTIAEAAGNKLLSDMIRDLRRRTHLFNTRRIPSRLKPGGNEHLALIDAILIGDAAKARALMTEHLDNVRLAIIDQLMTRGAPPMTASRAGTSR